MVTFSRITVTNGGKELVSVRLRLFVPGWDAMYVPAWVSPGIFGHGGPRTLPPVIELAAGTEAAGEVEFRIPFSEPSERTLHCRLMVVTADGEREVEEFSVPHTIASFIQRSEALRASEAPASAPPGSPGSS